MRQCGNSTKTLLKLALETTKDSQEIEISLFQKLDAEAAKCNETFTARKTRKDLIGRLTRTTCQNQYVRINSPGAIRHIFNLIAASMGPGGAYAGK